MRRQFFHFVHRFIAFSISLFPLINADFADTVFQNGSIYTLNPSSDKVEAVAIKNGRFTYIGTNNGTSKLIGNETTVVNLQGRMAMPGLIDSHMHVVSGGLFLLKCDLNYQPLTLEDVLVHVQQCINMEPEEEEKHSWLEVVNCDYPTLTTKSGMINKKDLDTLKTTRPVSVRSSDYHTVWANSEALKLSNITADTPNPLGGNIGRLPGSQEPSGILEDNASYMLAVPPPTEEINIAAINAALKLLREAGITTFQEAAASTGWAGAWEKVKQNGSLSARGYFDYRIEPPASKDKIEGALHDVLNVTSKFNDASQLKPEPILKWQAIKGFLDGVITYPSNTGALVEPYNMPVGNTSQWAPDNSTLIEPYWRSDILTLMVERLILNHIDAQFHADGDLAVRIVLDAVESFRNAHPNYTDYRIGIAHDELTHADDWPRFAKLGVDAIMSFQWAQLSSFWIPNTFNSMGSERHDKLEAFGTIAKYGRPIVYGSDWPIDPLDEFLALKVGVTLAGDPENPHSPASQGPQYTGTFPGAKLSREAALRAITTEGARFLRADKHIGSLEVGKLADVIVLEKNYFEVPEDEIGRQRVLMTMLGGTVLYVAEGVSFGDRVVPKFPNGNSTTALERKRVGMHRRYIRDAREHRCRYAH